MPDGAAHCKPRGRLLSPGVEQQVVRALGSIGSATLLSRVLGYVRDMIVALAFGAGPVTDAFFVAFRIPNILRRLLGEGALSTAVIPVFTDYTVEGFERAMSGRFEIVRREPIAGSERILYLMRGR